jgi:hypothetical protein
MRTSYYQLSTTFNPFNTQTNTCPKLPRRAEQGSWGAEQDHDTDCHRRGQRETNGETDYVSPMSDIPMKRPETVVETVDENEDDHRGEKSMMGLVKQTLRTENPTVDPLTLNPDNLVDRTFLMPPKEDGTRVKSQDHQAC